MSSSANVSPSTSPPRTPDDPRTVIKTRTSTTPSSDDSSIIDDLSFDYVFDKDGNYVRQSKGFTKTTSSSPPTPQDASLHPEGFLPPSPKLSSSPIVRASLSRSESAYPVLLGTSAATSVSAAAPSSIERPVRSFQRVASGPAIAMTPSYAAPTASSSKSRTVPRRITMEDARERDPLPRARHTLDPYHEEKENISETDDAPYVAPGKPAQRRQSPPLVTRSVSASSRVAPTRTPHSSNSSSLGSRPLAEVPLPQRTRQILPSANRPGRIIIKSTPSSSVAKYGSSAPSVPPSASYDRMSEFGVINEHEEPVGVALGGEDTEPEDEPVDPVSVPLPPPSLPPTTTGSGVGRHRSVLNVNVNVGSEPLSRSGNTRPRRSHSLSDALAHDDYQLQIQHQHQNPSSRPGTSLGLNGNGGNTAGPRRVTIEERDRQEIELRAEIKKYRQAEERDLQETHYQARQSPSPTHQQPAPAPSTSRPTYAHKRRDSDTLRSLMPPLSAGALGSPTAMDLPGRRGGASSPAPLSAGGRSQGRVSPPTAKGRTSPPDAATGMRTQGRVSPPTTKGRVSPPRDKGRLSPPTTNGVSSRAGMGREVVKHRRSPTAPEPPTTSGMMGSGERERERERAGKTWAAGEGRDEEHEYGYVSERERERERRAKYAQQQQQQQQAVPPVPAPAPAPVIPVAAAPAPAPPPAQLNRHIVVNKKAYARLDMIGKGGSSRVFRVLNHANELYAIKRVSLDKTDSETMSGYMNEIALLKRLEGNSRIIRLIDSEVRAGPGGSKGHLLLVMECGEIDLARLLQEQMREKVNMVWVAYYWQQMLQAVHVIHEEKIVHSDLKPANFVLVRGQLKLIDFGIANAIANDTTNIQRDHQIGTVNYMSPEAIELPDGMRRLKVGRPSDVWSLGCILYQMIYGHPPFQHLSVYQKMKAIPDLAHVIDFPEHATPSVPAPRSSNGSANGMMMEPEQPKKLDHLTTRVRADVIASMKSCLVRNPKERATIPELMDEDWLAMKEPEPRTLKDLLAADETVINPHYMRQLLEYGMRCGREGLNKDEQELIQDAQRLVAELKSFQ